jgi:hypothetical protein
MPLIQGGPPEWIWERTPEVLKWQVVPSQAPEGHTVYELRVNCGLEIMRLQFFTEDEIKELQAMLNNGPNEWENGAHAERVQPEREPGVRPEREPGNSPAIPEAERPPGREEGVVSDPDLSTAR